MCIRDSRYHDEFQQVDKDIAKGLEVAFSKVISPGNEGKYEAQGNTGDQCEKD